MREARNLIWSSISVIPNIHNAAFSHAQLSDDRKEAIAARRDQLKVMPEDFPVLRIVIEEMLAYKPRYLTLDDRYIQLEKILDAIDKTRMDKNNDYLLAVCSEIHQELTEFPGKTKNALLDRMNQIMLRIEKVQQTHCQITAKL